jgi:hypothetical protein
LFVKPPIQGNVFGGIGIENEERVGHATGIVPVFFEGILLELESSRGIDGGNETNEDGYDPCRVADSLFVFDANSSKYIPLDRRLYEQIQSGIWRL